MNTLRGTVRRCDSADGIHLLQVDVAGICCTAMALGDVAPAGNGDTVTLSFRELDVALACQLGGAISIRNQLPCTVRAIDHGQLMSRITLDMAGHTLHAVITHASAQLLALHPGQPVTALIKSHTMQLQHTP
jgi:molybdate transport system regulatory protein